MHPVAISACLLGGLSIGGSFRRRCYSPRPARGGAPATGVVAVCVTAAGAFVFLSLTIHPGRGCFRFSFIRNSSWPQVLLVFPSSRIQPPPCPRRCSSHRLVAVCVMAAGVFVFLPLTIHPGRGCFCFSCIGNLSWPQVLLVFPPPRIQPPPFPRRCSSHRRCCRVCYGRRCFCFLSLTIYLGRGCCCLSFIGNLSWPQVLLFFVSRTCPTGRNCFCFCSSNTYSWSRVLLCSFL